MSTAIYEPTIKVIPIVFSLIMPRDWVLTQAHIWNIQTLYTLWNSTKFYETETIYLSNLTI